MRNFCIILLSFLVYTFSANASITLQECRDKARENYPLVRKAAEERLEGGVIDARIDSACISVLQDRFLPIEAYYERAGGLKKLLDEDDLWLFGLARLSVPQDQATQISEWVNPWYQVNASRKKYLGTHLVLEYYDSAVNVLGLCTVTQSDDNGQNDAAFLWRISQ